MTATTTMCGAGLVPRGLRCAVTTASFGLLTLVLLLPPDAAAQVRRYGYGQRYGYDQRYGTYDDDWRAGRHYDRGGLRYYRDRDDALYASGYDPYDVRVYERRARPSARPYVYSYDDDRRDDYYYDRYGETFGDGRGRVTWRFGYAPYGRRYDWYDYQVNRDWRYRPLRHRDYYGGRYRYWDRDYDNWFDGLGIYGSVTWDDDDFEVDYDDYEIEYDDGEWEMDD